MSRSKSVLVVALLFAVTGITQQAHAAATATIKLMVAGSSAMWQAMGLAAYNNGNCPVGAVKPCFHYTNASSNKFSLTDTRTGTNITDTNHIWIVWDSKTTTAGQTPQVWAYIKVDTVVGVRCYFAHPRCNVSVSAFPAPGDQISSTLWGDGSSDQLPGASNNGTNVVAAFVTAAAKPLVNATASDIRPEDAMWAMCRVNSSLNASRKGLGYNSNWPAGQCATAGDATKAHYVGTDILAQLSGNTAHPIAFNISGTDPITGTAIPVFTTINVGGEPLIFATSLGGGGSLNTVTNVTDAQVQNVFSGANCNATALGAGVSDPLNVYLREPLSGTYNAIEYTVFAYPDFSGKTQETSVDPTVPATNNPLNKNCVAGGGVRQRGVGTGDIINQLWKDGGNGATQDSIGYTFFSYGNVTNGTKSITASNKWRYLTLNGVDPLFHTYVATPGQTVTDPGQPNDFVGEIPDATALPASCSGAFPCGEDKIWSGGGTSGLLRYGSSFPNVRSGQYRAWSVLRFISDGAALATAKSLVATSQVFATTSTPDFIPAAPVIAKAGPPVVVGDPGLSLLRSHYQEKDTAGTLIGGAPKNDGGSTPDVGGDVGGCILHLSPGVTAAFVAQSDATKQLVQNAPDSSGCAIFDSH
jgi:hypothetical protein